MCRYTPAGVGGAIVRTVTDRPGDASTTRVAARGDLIAGGNGPSPRARASRTRAAPTTHQAGIDAKIARTCALNARVSGAIAASANTAPSNGLSVGIARPSLPLAALPSRSKDAGAERALRRGLAAAARFRAHAAVDEVRVCASRSFPCLHWFTPACIDR